MRIWSVLLLVSVVLMGPAKVSGQGGSGAEEGGIFLLLPVGAQGVGVARAMTALEGPESVWWNPAGLARLDASRLTVTRAEEEVTGEGTTLSWLYHAPGLGVLGASYLLLDLGDVEFRDDQGNFLGQVSLRYHTGILSAATTVTGSVSLGMNLKLIQSRLSCRGQCLDAGVTATTYAVDAGIQWRDVAGTPLTLGSALVHAGPRLQVRNEAQADPLPTRIRVAAAYDVLRHWVDVPELQGRLTFELEDRWRDPGTPARYVAMEVSAGLDPAISLRAGYASGRELQVDGVGVGVGVRYERFDLGISKSLASGGLAGAGEPIHISFGFIFR